MLFKCLLLYKLQYLLYLTFRCKKFVIDEGLLNRARASENEPSCPLTTVSQLLALTVDASADVEEKHDAIALTGVVKRVCRIYLNSLVSLHYTHSIDVFTYCKIQ